MTENQSPQSQLTLLPLNDYILVEEKTEATQTKGGLTLPTNKGERTESVAIKGVVAAAPFDSTLKEGQVVWVNKWEAHIIKHGEKDYLCIKEKDIFATETT